MTNEVSGENAAAARIGDGKFRLVFHIGAGKTGTTSIQRALRTHMLFLRKQGTWYLGYMLEHAPVQRFLGKPSAGSMNFWR